MELNIKKATLENWKYLEEAEDKAGGLLACSPEIYEKMRLSEEEWAMKAAALEEGCSVTAGSLNPEYFFREIEKNKEKQ